MTNPQKLKNRERERETRERRDEAPEGGDN
jgi:hypothetical protein